MTEKKERNGGQEEEEKIPNLVEDILYCTALAGKALVQDEFSLCFQQKNEEDKPCANWRYWVGVAVRYFILLPVRVTLTVLSISAPILLFLLLRLIRVNRFNNHIVCLSCWLIVKSIGIRVKHIGVKQKPSIPNVFVANHTTYMDYFILSSHKFSHSVIAQKQNGFMSMLLKFVSGSIQFERKHRLDRHGVKKRIKEILKTQSLLIFPEGTCVNNEYTVMFQKGAFDLDVAVCPAAIKYNKALADPYWNTRKQSFTKHFVYFATRWRTEASVWWMPMMAAEKGEMASEFASRVKKRISERAGLKNLIWNGYLKYCKSPEEMKGMKIYADLSAPILKSITTRDS